MTSDESTSALPLALSPLREGVFGGGILEGLAGESIFATARGHARPFGATPKPHGVNFALFSRHAQFVNLVLLQEASDRPLAEISLDPKINKTGDVWHIFVFDLPTDVLYGYRINGQFAPKIGHLFNPRVVVLDPYARIISGGEVWGAPDLPRGHDPISGSSGNRDRVPAAGVGALI